MRSQVTKPQPNKGALVKPTFKQHSPTKQVKKKPIAASKKVKSLIKATVLKSVKKKNVTKSQTKNEESQDKETPNADTNKSESTKSPLSTRSNSPTKKNKNENKEKKVTVKKSASTVTKKRNIKDIKSVKKVLAETKKMDSGEFIKYKINSEHVKVNKKKSTKAKTKKLLPSGTNKKAIKSARTEKSNMQQNKKDESFINTKPADETQKMSSEDPQDVKRVLTLEIKLEDTEKLAAVNNSDMPDNLIKNNTSQTNASVMAKDLLSTPQKPRTETERPPKFFTSTRSPRIVDIDLKSCKTTKANVSLTDKFLSMKLPDKADVTAKIKSGESNATVSKEAEIDVYTFTDYKVDSPKSILSDFRSPINKNIGRIRPIARVKGTVIDKNKFDSDKKKYSPHKPIEEVVKQLKAGKKAEEAKLLSFPDSKLDNSNSSTSTSSSEPGAPAETSEHSNNDQPRSVVSKSYKMVARKSIPGTSTPRTNEVSSESVGTYLKASTSSTPALTSVKTLVKKKSMQSKKSTQTSKKPTTKSKISDDELDHSTFSLNTSSNSVGYSSSDESVSSNDDTKESSDSEDNTKKKLKKNRKKGMRIVDSERKSTSKDLEALSPDSLTDLKESSGLIGDEKPSKRRLKLLSMWTGPKKHRMASLNALAKVHCLYENESRTHMELGLMRTIERNIPTTAPKPPGPKKKPPKPDKHESTSESEYEKKVKSHLESSEEDSPPPSTRNLRVVPGARGSGKYWDHKSSTSSSEDSEADYKNKTQSQEKKKPVAKTVTPNKSHTEKLPAKMKKTAGVPIKKKRNRNEVVMDLKDMVVQKRMASLNASAIIAASNEKRSSKSSKDETTTSDSNSDKDETFAKKSKNGVASGVKSEAGIKIDECKKEDETSSPKQKVEVIVNQDTDVTITGVYSTHHEGFCTVSGMQYRISSTSHTQTTATASSEKEACSHEDSARYTPLSALSSMQPPADQEPDLHHTHPVHEHRGLSGLGRRPGCSSAFSAPPPNAQHDPGYYQPAGPLIKEGSAEADGRALARYHPPHYHAPPHPQMLQHYGSPYYPADLCYGGRYYRPAGPPGYLAAPPPQPDAQMVGVGGEPYPPAQYYSGPPCYHNSPQRVPYLEYRGCPCPINTCPKNVLIGPATGKPPNSGGPEDALSVPVVPPGGAFRPKARAARGPEPEPAINNGKDPPRDEPPTAADAPHLRYRPPLVPPAFSGVSPKRELYPDACEEFRLATEGPGVPAEALGPPSPARGSAGACVPQPPLAPPPPRRARLGKAMARKTLVGDDTGSLLLSPVAAPPPQPATTSEIDDDVLVLSSPDVECVPIDLSSSDETDRRDSRDRLLADVKKENEGPDGGVTVRKLPATDTPALREHNSPCTPLMPPLDVTKPPESPKPQATKRRYSRPKLEIEPSMEIVDGRPTNGIGEHVKLQKRRKFVPETETTATTRDTVDKSTEVAESKKKPYAPKAKRAPKLEIASKRCNKRKASSGTDAPPSKRLQLDLPKTDDDRLLSPAAMSEPLKKERITSKPKNRSAQLLDKLIRKNSVDRSDAPGSDYEPDPAELFPPPPAILADRTQNGLKKVLNINNNIVGETKSINDTRTSSEPSPARLIADRLLAKLAAGKIPKEKSSTKSGGKNIEISAAKLLSEKVSLKNHIDTVDSKLLTDKVNSKLISDIKTGANILIDSSSKSVDKISTSTTEKQTSNTSVPMDHVEKICVKPTEKLFTKTEKLKPNEKPTLLSKPDMTKQDKTTRLLSPKPENAKSVEKSSKLLSSKSDPIKLSEKTAKLICSKPDVNKLLVVKRPPAEIVTGEPSELVEEVCMKHPTIAPVLARRAQRRRRSGIRRRGRLSLNGPSNFSTVVAEQEPSLARVAPRWSNGWLWEGEPYLSKVYLNNDMRLDRVRRCYSGMVHTTGDRVRRGDCVLLRAAARRGPEQPFVARVAHLWENPDDGEMMVSLVWYYRPEHTEHGRLPGDAPDEVFASRHRDANSVACIEDKCYVLTFNEYCRYKKKLKATEEGITIPQSIVPPMPASEVSSAVAPNDTKLPPNVSPELVLFCRKIYDFRSKKIQVPNK